MNSFKKNQVIIAALAIMIVLAAYLNFSKSSDIDEGQYVFNNESNMFDNANESNSIIKEALVPNSQNEYTDASNTDVEGEEDADDVKIEEDLSSEEGDAVKTGTDGDSETDMDSEEKGAEDGTNETASLDKGESQVGEAVFVSSGAVDDTYFLDSKIKREQKRASRLEILLDVIENQNLSEESKIESISKMIEIQECIEKEALAESVLEAKGYEDVFVLIDDSTVDVIVRADELTQSQLAEIADVTSRKTGIELENVIIYPAK